MTGDRPWPKGCRRACGGNTPWALFLDFDGTLVDIADRPTMVVVDPALPRLLADLRRCLGGALAVISGRPIDSLDRLLAPLHLDIAGLHGVEWRCAGQSYSLLQVDARLRDAVHDLRVEAMPWPGTIVEDKGATIAVHYRLAPAHEAQVHCMVERTLKRLGPDFRLQSGKAVLEIVPVHANKGRALERFLSTPIYGGRRCVFAGDDAADDTALARVRALGGIAIRIGPESGTLAQVHISDPTNLRRLLGEWTRTGILPLEMRPEDDPCLHST